jgi:hypothetical protein
MLVLLAVPAAALSSGKAKRPDNAASTTASVSQKHSTTLRADVEIRVIREYFEAQKEKPKSLPPGIARQLARGKPLPPGIAKTRMPDALVRKLPTHDGLRWVLTGDVVLLVDVDDLIVDFVRAIF